MQLTQQTHQHKHLFATRIIKELEAEARVKMKGKKLTIIDEKNEYVTKKTIEYNRIKRWVYEKDVDAQKEYLKILKRIKSEAIGKIVLCRTANQDQLKDLGLAVDDILFEIEFRQLLSEWVELEADESLPIRQGLRDFAIGGKELNYNKLNSLEEELRLNMEHEKHLTSTCLTKRPEREKYDKCGNEIDYLSEDNKHQDIGKEVRENATRRIHIKKEINYEKWRISEEKSEGPNLCYFILYDKSLPLGREATTIINYDPVTSRVVGCEDNDRVNYRIQNLSKYYLKILVRVICNINNEYYKEEIEANSKALKKMNRKTNKMSIQDKKELIQMGKSEGLTNKEISKQLGKGFGLRTIERYSN
jgi:hypothetical protein